MHFAELVSDRAYVLEKGQIRFSGTMDELARNDEVRRHHLACRRRALAQSCFLEHSSGQRLSCRVRERSYA